MLDIDATIFCEKETHKRIIIGKNGSMLKKISTFARQDIERFFDCKGIPTDMGKGKRGLAKPCPDSSEFRL